MTKLVAAACMVMELVHTPHIGRLDEDQAAVQKNNKPLFRDRGPFPWDTVSSAGQGPVNARLLWEAGITYGYGTDTSWHPRETLADELRALQLVFSPKDIVTILTRNAAISAMKGDQLGTLEAGKAADIVILEGDPLANPASLLNVAMVIRGGEVIVQDSAHSVEFLQDGAGIWAYKDAGEDPPEGSGSSIPLGH